MIISNNFSSECNEGVVVWRQPPVRRMIFLDMSDISYALNFPKTNYFLSFPYIFYSMHYKVQQKGKISLIRLLLSFSPTSELNKLFYPALFNIESNLQCCLGNDFFIFQNIENIEKLCSIVINSFWQSEYSDDISGSIDQYSLKKTILSNYLKWENKTKENPLWVPDKKDLLEGNTESYYMSYFMGNRFK